MLQLLVTYTGKRFDYKNIKPDNIHVPDILHSLSLINRFIGHSCRPYSVAEHTYLGLVMAEKLGYTPLQQLHWLIHDFTEAYVGDCPTPLKKLLPKFYEIEKEVELAILKHFGLQELTDEEFYLVKRIDITMLVLEMRDLTLHDHREYLDHHTYISILSDDDFKINKTITPTDLPSILESLLNNLLEETKMNTYNIYVGIEQENFKWHVENNVKLKNDADAIEYAKDFAKELYQMNPTRDVLEILNEENVDEDVAYLIFKSEAILKSTYHVTKVVDGEEHVVGGINRV